MSYYTFLLKSEIMRNYLVWIQYYLNNIPEIYIC